MTATWWSPRAVLARGGAGVLLLVAGCTTAPTASGPPTPPADLDAPPDWTAARERWAARGPSRYRFVWWTATMVGEARTLVEVRDRHVVGATALTPATDPWSTSGLTVDDAFARVREAQRSADGVTVTYDPELGQPLEVLVDPERNTIDEERSFGVRDLRAL